MARPCAGMCSPPASIPLLQMIVKLTGAKKIGEVGFFTGFTALGMVLALPEGGVLHACDIAPQYPAIGEPHWKAAGVSDKVKLYICPANDTLVELLAAEGEGSFDLGFIDADKVLDADPTNEDTKAIQAINDKIYKDERVDICMLPISDGVTIARKK